METSVSITRPLLSQLSWSCRFCSCKWSDEFIRSRDDCFSMCWAVKFPLLKMMTISVGCLNILSQKLLFWFHLKFLLAGRKLYTPELNKDGKTQQWRFHWTGCGRTFNWLNQLFDLLTVIAGNVNNREQFMISLSFPHLELAPSPVWEILNPPLKGECQM